MLYGSSSRWKETGRKQHLQQSREYRAYTRLNALCERFGFGQKLLRYLEGFDANFQAGMLEISDLCSQEEHRL